MDILNFYVTDNLLFYIQQPKCSWKEKNASNLLCDWSKKTRH